jgi:hypothetical protein
MTEQEESAPQATKVKGRGLDAYGSGWEAVVNTTRDLRFHVKGIPWVAEELLACQEGRSSMHSSDTCDSCFWTEILIYINLDLSIAPNCDGTAVRYKREQPPPPSIDMSRQKVVHLFKPTSTVTTVCRPTVFSSTKKLSTVYLWVSHVPQKIGEYFLNNVKFGGNACTVRVWQPHFTISSQILQSRHFYWQIITEFVFYITFPTPLNTSVRRDQNTASQYLGDEWRLLILSL